MAGDEFNPRDFRDECAAFVKFLLAARGVAQLGFVDREMRVSWYLAEGFASTRTVAQYLRSAKMKLDAIDVRYGVPGCSLGIGPVAHESVEELQLNVSFLVYHEAGHAFMTIYVGAHIRSVTIALD